MGDPLKSGGVQVDVSGRGGLAVGGHGVGGFGGSSSGGRIFEDSVGLSGGTTELASPGGPGSQSGSKIPSEAGGPVETGPSSSPGPASKNGGGNGLPAGSGARSSGRSNVEVGNG